MILSPAFLGLHLLYKYVGIITDLVVEAKDINTIVIRN